MMSEENWRAQLVGRYANLFGHAAGGVSGYPYVGDGWQRLVQSAVHRMASAVAGVGTGSIRIVHIEEKNGRLTIHFEGHSLPTPVLAEVREAADLAEARSQCICDLCGARGWLYETDGWLATRCEAHGKGTRDDSEPASTEVFIKWTVEDRTWRLLSSRRYDRDKDAFIEVSLPDGLALPGSGGRYGAI